MEQDKNKPVHKRLLTSTFLVLLPGLLLLAGGKFIFQTICGPVGPCHQPFDWVPGSPWEMFIPSRIVLSNILNGILIGGSVFFIAGILAAIIFFLDRKRPEVQPIGHIIVRILQSVSLVLFLAFLLFIGLTVLDKIKLPTYAERQKQLAKDQAEVVISNTQHELPQNPPSAEDLEWHLDTYADTIAQHNGYFFLRNWLYKDGERITEEPLDAQLKRKFEHVSGEEMQIMQVQSYEEFDLLQVRGVSGCAGCSAEIPYLLKVDDVIPHFTDITDPHVLVDFGVTKPEWIVEAPDGSLAFVRLLAYRTQTLVTVWTHGPKWHAGEQLYQTKGPESIIDESSDLIPGTVTWSDEGNRFIVDPITLPWAQFLETIYGSDEPESFCIGETHMFGCQHEIHYAKDKKGFLFLENGPDNPTIETSYTYTTTLIDWFTDGMRRTYDFQGKEIDLTGDGIDEYVVTFWHANTKKPALPRQNVFIYRKDGTGGWTRALEIYKGVLDPFEDTHEFVSADNFFDELLIEGQENTYGVSTLETKNSVGDSYPVIDKNYLVAYWNGQTFDTVLLDADEATYFLNECTHPSGKAHKDPITCPQLFFSLENHADASEEETPKK